MTLRFSTFGRGLSKSRSRVSSALLLYVAFNYVMGMSVFYASSTNETEFLLKKGRLYCGTHRVAYRSRVMEI